MFCSKPVMPDIPASPEIKTLGQRPSCFLVLLPWHEKAFLKIILSEYSAKVIGLAIA